MVKLLVLFNESKGIIEFNARTIIYDHYYTQHLFSNHYHSVVSFRPMLVFAVFKDVFKLLIS